jgi:hypothetical protein
VPDWEIVHIACDQENDRRLTAIIRLDGDLDVAVLCNLSGRFCALPLLQLDRQVLDVTDASPVDCRSAALLFRLAGSSLPPDVRVVIRSPCALARRLADSDPASAPMPITRGEPLPASHRP